MKKVMFVAGVVACLLVASNALADLVPPPKPLHRIGYEILGPKESQIWQDPKILRLRKEIEYAQHSNEVAKVKAMEERFREELERLRKEMIDRLMENHGGWKMPQDLTKAECDEFASRIKVLQTELQKAFDAEYAALLAAGKLKWIKLFNDAYQCRRERYVRETQVANAQKVVESIMEKNVEMRQKCKGIPIEFLANAMSCPTPSIDPVDGEIERYRREMRELHQSNRPGEPFDLERMRQLQEEHRKRMKELQKRMFSGE